MQNQNNPVHGLPPHIASIEVRGNYVYVRLRRGLPEEEFRRTIAQLKKMGFKFDTNTWRREIIDRLHGDGRPLTEEEVRRLVEGLPVAVEEECFDDGSCRIVVDYTAREPSLDVVLELHRRLTPICDYVSVGERYDRVGAGLVPPRVYRDSYYVWYLRSARTVPPKPKPPPTYHVYVDLWRMYLVLETQSREVYEAAIRTLTAAFGNCDDILGGGFGCTLTVNDDVERAVRAAAEAVKAVLQGGGAARRRTSLDGPLVPVTPEDVLSLVDEVREAVERHRERIRRTAEEERRAEERERRYRLTYAECRRLYAQDPSGEEFRICMERHGFMES